MRMQRDEQEYQSLFDSSITDTVYLQSERRRLSDLLVSALKEQQSGMSLTTARAVSASQIVGTIPMSPPAAAPQLQVLRDHPAGAVDSSVAAIGIAPHLIAAAQMANDGSATDRNIPPVSTEPVYSIQVADQQPVSATGVTVASPQQQQQQLLQQQPTQPLSPQSHSDSTVITMPNSVGLPSPRSQSGHKSTIVSPRAQAAVVS